MIEAEKQFAECLAAKLPPPMDGSKATTRAIEQLYPKNNNVILPASERALARRDRLWVLTEEINRLEKQEQQCTRTIKMALGFSEVMEGVAKWKVRVVERLDETLLQATDPEIYNESKKQGDLYYRVLRPKADYRTREEKSSELEPAEIFPAEEVAIGSTIDPTEAAQAAAAQLQEIQPTLKFYRAEEARLKNELRMEIRDNDGIANCGTWKRQPAMRVNHAWLKFNHPDLAKMCTPAKKCRYFELL
jgi:predicted phage-related endonuclease